MQNGKNNLFPLSSIVTIDGTERHTSVVNKSGNPVWKDEVFELLEANQKQRRWGKKFKQAKKKNNN